MTFGILNFQNVKKTDKLFKMVAFIGLKELIFIWSRNNFLTERLILIIFAFKYVIR